MIGQTISHYKILEKLGEGGMGVVYKAQDTKLDRLVALKFLPEHLSGSAQDKARFIQEAKAASALNHPNVCTVHDIQEYEDQLFIVMELVDGQTLREKKSHLSFKQAVEVSIQIAEGLAAAHERGIVHRDIKPENIMIRKDGIAQIMDFGLAKLRGVSKLTKEGSTIGTLGYMSPEQVQGHDVDHRTDIFSLGVVFYELFTGEMPFRAVHETAIMYEIVNIDAVPMSTLKGEIEADLDRIVLECLVKDPNERSQSAKQISIDLQRFKRESSRSARTMQPGGQRISRSILAQPSLHLSGIATTSGNLRTRLKRDPLGWGIVVVLLAAVVTLIVRQINGPSAQPYAMRSSIVLADSIYIHSVGFFAGPPVISPDASKIVFAGITPDGVQQLFVRSMEELAAHPLDGTKDGTFPFWSPDAKYIGFFSSDGKLKKVGAAGGPSVTICNAPNPRGASWSKEGVIIFTPEYITPILRVSADGGTPEPVTTFDTTRHEASHRWPFFLPDGQHFLYFSRTTSSAGQAEGHALFAASLDGKLNKLLLPAISNAVYATGYLLFMRGSTLMAQRFDEGSLELRGDASIIADQVLYNPPFNLGIFSVSQTGVLIYQTGTERSGGRLLIMDRSGNINETLGDISEHYRPHFSPDGQHIALSLFDTKTYRLNIWLYDARTGGRSRLTSGLTEDYAVWSPDGSKIAYSSFRDGHWNIYQRDLTHSGAEELLHVSLSAYRGGAVDWSRDGKNLLYVDGATAAPGSNTDLLVIPMMGDRKPYAFVQTEFSESEGRISPDAKWVAYKSNEGGDFEIYIRRFAGVQKQSMKISTGGGRLPRWGANSNELFFVSTSTKQMMIATLHAANDGIEITGVHPAFNAPIFLEDYDVSHSGNRIVITRYLEMQKSSPLTIAVNWNTELEKK